MSGGSAEIYHQYACASEDSLSPRDRQELKRQEVLLQNAFSYVYASRNNTKVALLEGALRKVHAVCTGEESMADFTRFQESVMGSADYAFLGEHHPGLNVNGWRVLYALIEPLKYGKDIHRVIENDR